MDWQTFFDVSLIPEAILKFAIVICLGGLIGLEREAHGQDAGFRTFILLAVGSCLIMMVSLHIETMYRAYGAESSVRIDPGRIASYALAGMGFIGAGAIISGRGSVRGITTAAGMWMITAVGLAVGSGYFIPAILVTFLSLFILYVLRHTKPFFRRDMYATLILVSQDVGGQLDRIRGVIRKYRRTNIQFVSFHRRLDEEVISFRLSLRTKEDIEWPELMSELTELPGVREIALEEGRVA